jgi:phage shock protein PspC (stress-responsive transcriptional regulator)
MNKLINANLGGRSFAIDEDAYLRLKSYLDAIREKFRGETFADEVVADIEAHAAEQFAAKHGAEHIISLANVEELIANVGKAEEVAGVSGTEEKFEKKTRRLYRNPDDMIVAGVSSGIASYFGIDPVIVRLLFVGATLLGASGVFIYLVLWLIVPLAQTPSEKLEMRGEAVTISNIEAMIKEKFREVHAEESIHRATEAVRPTAKRVGDVLRDIFLAIASVIGVLLRIAFYIILTLALIAIIFGAAMLTVRVATVGFH